MGFAGRALLAVVFAAALVPAPGAAQVPTPASVLGFDPGDDFTLTTYEESIRYFEALAGASDRVTLLETGRTSFGRSWRIAVISSPENLAALERHKETARRLAHPEGLTDGEARALARDGVAIVDVSGGLHATEVAGVQHTIHLAYELASSEDPRIQAIRDNVILVLWPSLNPDGQTIVADWYRSNVGTEFETAPLPELYQKYVGHDNNRDAYMLNMVESRGMYRTWREWEPQIIYVHHQSSPFPTRIWLPPFAEPITPQAPPLISRTVNTLGMTIAQMLESRGMRGAVHMGTGFDAWYPGYVDYLPVLQHQAAFWTETALYRYATPYLYTLADYPESRRDLRAETLYPSPWEGGWWHLRDAVDYMRVGSIAVLDWAAKYREDLLYNRYQSGRDAIARYRTRPPYAYFIPREQRDPMAPVELLRRLAFNGVRIHELTGAVTHEGVTHPAGTWVIAMDQEFGPVAQQLLEVQEYPDLREYPDGPPEQPYDAAGWTLPYQMDVRVVEAREPLSGAARSALRAVRGEAVAWNADTPDAAPFDMAAGVGFDTDPVAAGILPAPGRVTGSGPALILDPAQNNAFRALNEAWNAGATVRKVPAGGSGTSGGGAGSSGGVYAVTGLSAGAMDQLASRLALQVRRGPASGAELRRPRIGLYRPWTASMDEGWTRWLFERFGFEHTSLRDADVRAGGLGHRYDVIVLPAESAGRLREGFEPGTVPPRYAGGLGDEGVRELAAFVEGGGTMVCLNQSSELCITALDLPVRNVVAHLRRDEFFSSGSIMETVTDPSHAVLWGMPERARIFFDRSPVFDTEEGFRGRVLARYQDAGSPLLSGYLLGEEHMNGRAAALDVEAGDGHVILLGFRPQWRGQPYGTFRVLFNSVLE